MVVTGGHRLGGREENNKGGRGGGGGADGGVGRGERDERITWTVKRSN